MDQQRILGEYRRQAFFTIYCNFILNNKPVASTSKISVISCIEEQKRVSRSCRNITRVSLSPSGVLIEVIKGCELI